MLLNGFKSFLNKTNALALAVGVIIGAATEKVVASLVNDLLMPIIALALPAGDWRNAQIILSQSYDATGQVSINAIRYGHGLGALIDFVIIALVVFVITKLMLSEATSSPPEPQHKVLQ